MRLHAVESPAAPFARRCTDGLANADRIAAQRALRDALHAGMSPEAVMAQVLTPALVRVGDLWSLGALGIEAVGAAAHIGERLVDGLCEHLPPATGHRERILLAAVEGQQHVLGLRMIGGVLAANGFDVTNLGPDVPVGRLRAEVAERAPAVVGLSCGMPGGACALVRSPWAVHETDPQARVMLGGRCVPPILWEYPRVCSTLDVVPTVEKLLAEEPMAPKPYLAPLLAA